MGVEKWLLEEDREDALATAVYLVKATTHLPHLPNMTITVSSDIPIASGLGSGAAIAAAAIRAVTQFVGHGSPTNGCRP